jgi:hypothetical protein
MAKYEQGTKFSVGGNRVFTAAVQSNIRNNKEFFNLPGESDEERLRRIQQGESAPAPAPAPAPAVTNPNVDVSPGWTELPSSTRPTQSSPTRLSTTANGKVVKSPLTPAGGPYIWDYKSNR